MQGIFLRSLYLVIETIFTLFFWTIVAKEGDWCMPRLSSWAHKALGYLGCNRHFSIYEQFGNYDDLSTE